MASQSETNQYINISIDEGGGVYFIPSAPSLWVLSSAILVEFPAPLLASEHYHAGSLQTGCPHVPWCKHYEACRLNSKLESNPFFPKKCQHRVASR